MLHAYTMAIVVVVVNVVVMIGMRINVSTGGNSIRSIRMVMNIL